MNGRNKIVGVVGRRGSGKSTVAAELLQRVPRLFLWDAMAEYDWCPNPLYTLADVHRFLAWSRGQARFAGRYVPQQDLAKEFGPLAREVYCAGNLVFGVEEAPMLCSPGSLPYDFDRIVRLGRHQGVSLLWTAQRMVEVARRLTAATDVFVIFKHTEPIDLRALEERCGVEVAHRVSQLGLHDRLVWDVIQSAEVPITGVTFP